MEYKCEAWTFNVLYEISGTCNAVGFVGLSFPLKIYERTDASHYNISYNLKLSWQLSLIKLS
jgi:hypothetical protein